MPPFLFDILFCNYLFTLTHLLHRRQVSCFIHFYNPRVSLLTAEMFVEFHLLNFESIFSPTKLISTLHFFNQILERDACSLISLIGEVWAFMGFHCWESLICDHYRPKGLRSDVHSENLNSEYELSALVAKTGKMLLYWDWPTLPELVRARDVDGNQVWEVTLRAYRMQSPKEAAEPQYQKAGDERQIIRNYRSTSNHLD